MPGTVQVTVLEFKGVSSSSKPSAKSLKVSMGKRHYQTWDKGDFSFPITKLREDLIVALLDAGGNEIAHADIRTMQIIEKGSWDEVFSINGGGHVHMKLQFILSEEERNRIRVMRESAMKKKLETNPNINIRLPETVSSSDSEETSTKNIQKVSDSQKGFVEINVVSPEVEASQAGSSLTSATSSAVSLSSYQKEGGTILESAIPVKELSVNAIDGSQGAPSSPGKHGVNIESTQVHERITNEKIETQPLANIRSDIEEGASSKLSGSAISDKNNSVASKLQDDPIQKSQDQGPLEKTPSNVRKMISAFENSQLQEVKSLKKAPSIQSQLNRFREEGLLEDRESKAVLHPADKSLRNLKDHFAGNLHQTPTTISGRGGNVSSDAEPSQAPIELASMVTPILSGGNDSNIEDMPRAAPREPTVKELDKSPVDLMRQSTSETATSSGRMPEEQSQVTQAYKLSTRLLNASEFSVAEGSGRGRGRGTGLKSSTMINIQVASNPKPKSLEYYKEECYSAQSSGMWIFPDNTRRLCITTAGKQVMKIVGHHHNEAKTRQVKKISPEPEMLEKNLMHGTEHKIEKNQKKIADQPESGYGSSPDDSSNGLIGQVIKIAVIMGFGVLVLLTRQKEPRKKHTEENDNIFPIPDYVDERTLKPWPRQQ
ncbi:hypothetical protein Pfo_003789 [Paulownia fortunei]|nr:hypothetical protein Pfo_003789 [Paulownia fortunei]